MGYLSITSALPACVASSIIDIDIDMLLALLLTASVLTVQSASVEDSFKAHGVVPDVIPVAPSQLLKVRHTERNSERKH